MSGQSCTPLWRSRAQLEHAKPPSTMWTDVVDGKRLQFAEFRAAEFDGTGQWVVYPDVWAEFSKRHSFREDATAIETAVATRSL